MTQSWDPTWETVFSSKEWGKYPPEELVRFVARGFYKSPERKAIRLLDAGCGTGACSWFVSREGFSLFGIDGSPTAIRRAKKRFVDEKIFGEFLRGDINQLPFKNASFDGVFEVAAIQQNRVAQIRKIISEVRRILKPNGRFFSMFLKEGTWGDNTGECLEPHTFTAIPEGPYHGLGVTHYATEVEIKDFFSDFSNIELEVSTRTLNSQTQKVEHWVISAVR